MSNKKITMSKRPIEFPDESNFNLINEGTLELKDGEVRLQTLWLSLDPYMRGRMRILDIGETMIGEVVAKVTESKSKHFSEGSIVLSKSGWQSEPIVNGETLVLVDSRIKPHNLAIGPIGMPGLTAYFGLMKIGLPKPGETVVVSAGSGAVGSVVGQIAKYAGCKVIGIAGSEHKVRYMLDDLNFDAGINYKDSDWEENLTKSCPDGVDIYFDNVGGVISDKVINEINEFARVIICGQISQYNNSNIELGPRNHMQFLTKRAKLEGFMVYTYQDQYLEGVNFLLQMNTEGLLKYRETVVEGIENAPSAFLKLFRGENFGKLLIKVS